jgi:hypothetical protein
MSRNFRIIGLALVNSLLAFLCGVSFGPFFPGRPEAPGNLAVVFSLVLGLTLFIMLVRGELEQ